MQGSLAVSALIEAGAHDPAFALRFWGGDRVAKAVYKYLCLRFGIGA